MRSTTLAVAVLLFFGGVALAAERGRTRLPDEHEYQRVLRGHLASLAEADFEIDATRKFTQPPDRDDPELRYRHWMLGLLNQPLIGSKRGMPAINAPARLFTLAAIETPEGVMQPPLWPEPAAFVVGWDYEGNPHRGSWALKLRTFAVLCVLMTMLDDHLEHSTEPGVGRFDTLAPPVLTLAWPYPAIRDAVPKDVQAAYETGLRKLARRLLDADPRGVQPNLIAVGPLAVWHVGQALGDAAMLKEAEGLGRRFWTDPAFFNPVGYPVDRGGIDLGYAGTANLFTAWAALATDWPFAREALDRSYRLRGRLTLPDPDGKWFGPTHFNSRLGSDIPRDQWEWGVYRDQAVALVTPEAAHLTRLPTEAELADGAAARARAFQGQLNENAVNAARNGFLRNDELTSFPWKYRLWQSWSFPLSVNFAAMHAPRDAWANRLKLETDRSPWRLSPWDRESEFVHEFGGEFTAVKRAGYRAIVHTGRVGGSGNGDPPETPFLEFSGFGGGQLSAYWTPATGSLILGRRGGASRTKLFDTLETWRLWPIHAVSGLTDGGAIVTSARIRRPDVERRDGAIRVSGTFPATMLGQEKALVGRIDFARSFALNGESVRVETSLRADGRDAFVELYETIPVFLRESSLQADASPTKIEFRVGDDWKPAGGDWSSGVTAVRLTRFAGSAEIRFDRPRRVKLSPEDWTDAYMSRASCRNVLVDLLESDGEAKPLREARIAWRTEPTGK